MLIVKDTVIAVIQLQFSLAAQLSCRFLPIDLPLIEFALLKVLINCLTGWPISAINVVYGSGSVPISCELAENLI